MPDDATGMGEAPTPEQENIAQHGTDAERLALAGDPNVSDAVHLLFSKDIPRVLEAAVRTARSVAALTELSKHAGDVILCTIAARAPEVGTPEESDALLLSDVFAGSTLASVIGAAAQHFSNDELREPALRDERAVVRSGALRGMNSIDRIEAHLLTEPATGPKSVGKARIQDLRAAARAQAEVAAPSEAGRRPQAQVNL
jgi:hypothetical protein